MAVPAVPGPDLVIRQADLLLGNLEALLDGPTPSGDAGEGGKRGIRRTEQRNRRAGQACLDTDERAASPPRGGPRAAVAGASGAPAPNRRTARLWHRHPPREAATPLAVGLPSARRQCAGPACRRASTTASRYCGWRARTGAAVARDRAAIGDQSHRP